jgi:hypothetical protein
MAERKQVDWESVERDYSAGLLSLREIAEKYGVSKSLVERKKNAENWTRDLNAKIQSKADSIIASSGVDSKGVDIGVDNKKTSEKEVIEANAQAIVNIKLEHRGDIRKSKRLVNALFDELELTTDNRELFEQLGEILRQESESGYDKLNDIYKKCIDLFGLPKGDVLNIDFKGFDLVILNFKFFLEWVKIKELCEKINKEKDN